MIFATSQRTNGPRARANCFRYATPSSNSSLVKGFTVSVRIVARICA
jgi:hypothetical protein